MKLRLGDNNTLNQSTVLERQIHTLANMNPNYTELTTRDVKYKHFVIEIEEDEEEEEGFEENKIIKFDKLNKGHVILGLQKQADAEQKCQDPL